MALLIILMAYMLVFMSRKKVPYNYLICSFLLINLYITLSIINSEFYVFYPLRDDAIHFYEASVYISEHPSERMGFLLPFGLSSNWYSHQVSLLYVLSKSIFIGQGLAIAAYAASLPLLYRIANRLNVENYTIAILFIFSLHPMHMLVRVGFLRESWEVLLVMCGFWLLLNILDRKKTILSALGLVPVFFLGAKLHYVFIYILLVVVPFMFISYKVFNIKNNVSKRLVISISIFTFLVLLVWIEPYLSEKHMIAIKMASRIDTHTGYLTPGISNSTLLPLIMFIHYMTSPLPWEINNTIDFLSFCLSFLRVLLVIFSIKNIVEESNHDTKVKKMMLFLFCISIAFIFSQGVSAYGTALRHQLLTYWGLVILGVPALMNSAGRILRLPLKNSDSQ